MKILWDAVKENMYPIATDAGVTSGSVVMVREITKGLAERGHTVHVVCNDLEEEEQRGERLWFWPAAYHPTAADVVVMTHQLSFDVNYSYNKLVLAHTGCTPELGPSGEWAEQIDAWPVFSETHKRLLVEHNPMVHPERVYVTGLGVDLSDYRPTAADLVESRLPPDTWYQSRKVPGRLLYANDPQRGLWETLDVFDLVRKEIPHASLHIAYDFDTNLERVRWQHSYMAQRLLECKRRIETTPGVVSLGAVSREQIIREQLECQVHCYPMAPTNHGTQTHGLTQGECAAAGAALVLSDVEAFPEVFGEAAVILPQIGKYVSEWERRVTAEDYAAQVVALMTKPAMWQQYSVAARALAERLSWSKVLDAWEKMLACFNPHPTRQSGAISTDGVFACPQYSTGASA